MADQEKETESSIKFPSISISWTDRKSYSLLFLGIIVSSAVMFGAAVVFGPGVGIKGSYAIGGLIAATAVFHKLKSPNHTRIHSKLSDMYALSLSKLFFIIYFLFITVVVLFQLRLIALIPMLLLNYGIIGAQLYRKDVGSLIPLQATLLLIASPIVKYTTTRLYFGNVDVLRHIRWTNNLLQYGTTTMMGETWYQTFAGLHLTTGAVSLTTGLRTYDALYLLGVATYSLIPMVVYCFSRALGKDALFSAMVSVIVTTIPHLSFYASYFYPQSMAFVLMTIVIYLFYRIKFTSTAKGGFAIVLGVITMAAMFTHHLTFVLYIPVFSLLLISTLGGRQIIHDRIQTFSLWFVGALWVAEVYLLLTIGRSFTKILLTSTLVTLLSIGFKGGQAAKSLYLFGVDFSPKTISTSISWIVGPHGVYFGTLVMVFSLGLIAIFYDWEADRRMIGVYVVGVAGAILVPKTPIPIKSRFRIGLVFVIFFAFIMSKSIHLLIENRAVIARIVPIALVILILLGSMAPLVPSSDFYKTHPTPSTQSSFTEGEYQALEQTSLFVEQYSMDVSAVWLTRQAMDRFGTETSWAHIENSKIRFQNALVYRTGWTNYMVNIETKTNYFNQFLISKRWLKDAVAKENKVYTTGKAGIVWERNKNYFGE